MTNKVEELDSDRTAADIGSEGDASQDRPGRRAADSDGVRQRRRCAEPRARGREGEKVGSGGLVCYRGAGRSTSIPSNSTSSRISSPANPVSPGGRLRQASDGEISVTDLQRFRSFVLGMAHEGAIDSTGWNVGEPGGDDFTADRDPKHRPFGLQSTWAPGPKGRTKRPPQPRMKRRRIGFDYIGALRPD